MASHCKRCCCDQVFSDSPDGSDVPDERFDGYDPRTVDNLVDGHNYTTDDLHAWLARFQVRDRASSVLCVGVDDLAGVLDVFNSVAGT